MLKSGSDFREFSVIRVYLDVKDEDLNEDKPHVVIDHTKKMIIDCQKFQVTKQYDPHPEMNDIVDCYWKDLAIELEKIAGHSGVDLDARFEKIRTCETNLSNFVADALRFMTKSDL